MIINELSVLLAIKYVDDEKNELKRYAQWKIIRVYVSFYHLL
jgi:hypothetical protein